MSEGMRFTESQLKEIEERGDPAAIPSLVDAIRQQQRELDNLRLSLDVARRDREELRVALLDALGRRGSGEGEREGSRGP